MNCATTNACFDNDKLSFGNGIITIDLIRNIGDLLWRMKSL